MTNLTQEQLSAVLSYDPICGLFTRSNGKLAGTINGRGYQQISIAGRLYLAHRLAWLYVHGQWPSAEIDHINGDKLDNRIANLREATRSQNSANSRMPKDSRSGVKGVSWDPKRQRWRAQIHHKRRTLNLGDFETKEAAASVYQRAAKALFGEFARTS